MLQHAAETLMTLMTRVTLPNFNCSSTRCECVTFVCVRACALLFAGY